MTAGVSNTIAPSDQAMEETPSKIVANSQSTCTSPASWPSLPEWANAREDWGSILYLEEWDKSDAGPDTVNDYRQSNGWKGRDLVHSSIAPVTILEYRIKYPMQHSEEKTTLTGLVHFTNRAESHKGYCHGGGMCSIMDDIIGWTGFCASGKCLPWSGFTVQINTKLCKPIPVDKVLKITCFIEKVERRKVFLKALLIDPGQSDVSSDKKDGGAVHAESDGIVILNRGVLPGTD